MRQIQLFGSGIRSYSAIATRQRRLNCFYDLRKDQDGSLAIVVGTPGYFSWATVDSNPIRGYHVVGSVLYVVAGKTLYKITTGGVVSTVGVLATVSTYVSMADRATELVIVDGVAGYSVTVPGGVISTITDGNFPNGATTVAFLDSRFIVEKPSTREFAVSATLDGKTWTPYLFGTKENSGDLLLAVDALNGVLVLFGDTSVEYWQNVGASPLPYSRINGATHQYGLAAKYSIVHAKGTLFYLAKNPDGGYSVVMLNGYAPQVISDADTESIINNLSIAVDAISLAYHSYGHTIYQITFPSAGRTLCYDIDSGLWHEAQSGASLSARHNANLGVAFNGKNLVSDASTGNVYQMDDDVFTDNGDLIKREVCTKHIRAEGNVFHLNGVLVDMESGVSPGIVTLEVSRDGGNIFGPEKQASLGSIGGYLTRVMYRRLGRARDIVLRIKMVANARFAIRSMSVDIEAAND